MSVLPAGYTGGTSLNPQVTSYETLAQRISYFLGVPLVQLEIADVQMYSIITDAIEYFTKWAGYTEEYLVFDSRLYKSGIGLKVDTMINDTKELRESYTSTVSSTMSYVLTSVTVPATFVTNPVLINSILNIDPDDTFQIKYITDTAGTPISATLTYQTTAIVISNVTPSVIGYDYDLASYRKVVDCFSFTYGESTGINTLFTMEQAMAQQIYSSYMIGNHGFDLTTWQILKDFIDTRTKVLAMTPHFRFDNRTQYLKIIPEPIPEQSYYGVVGCYIERPIKDVIRERWVQKYAIANTKIAVANVRGKFKGTGLFANGSVNADDFMQQGLKEKETLEQELMNSYQDNLPAMFFIG